MKVDPVVEPRLVNIRVAARYLGCPIWTVRNLEWQGKLRSIRTLGRALKFDIRDLDAMVEEMKEGRVQ